MCAVKELSVLHDRHLHRPTLDDSSEEEQAIEMLTEEITQVTTEGTFSVAVVSIQNQHIQEWTVLSTCVVRARLNVCLALYPSHWLAPFSYTDIAKDAVLCTPVRLFCNMSFV